MLLVPPGHHHSRPRPRQRAQRPGRTRRRSRRREGRQGRARERSLQEPDEPHAAAVRAGRGRRGAVDFARTEGDRRRRAGRLPERRQIDAALAAVAGDAGNRRRTRSPRSTRTSASSRPATPGSCSPTCRASSKARRRASASATSSCGTSSAPACSSTSSNRSRPTAPTRCRTTTDPQGTGRLHDPADRQAGSGLRQQGRTDRRGGGARQLAADLGREVLLISAVTGQGLSIARRPCGADARRDQASGSRGSREEEGDRVRDRSRDPHRGLPDDAHAGGPAVTPDVVVDIGNSRMKWGLCEDGRVSVMEITRARRRGRVEAAGSTLGVERRGSLGSGRCCTCAVTPL